MAINMNNAQNEYQLPEIKVMVVGPSSGKTTWINNISGNESNFTSVTLGAEVTPIEIYTKGKKIRLHIWEVGSQYSGLCKDYCIGARLAIVFKKTGENHEIFENWVTNLPKMYVENYDVSQNQNIKMKLKELIESNTTFSNYDDEHKEHN